MEVITLSEFAKRCKSCDPAVNPQEALALLQEAAKIALGAEILQKKHNDLRLAKAEERLLQADEIISRAVELADKVISAEKFKPEKKTKKEQAERKKYGEYKHVLLTDEQYQKLITDFGAEQAAEGIKKVDEYCQQVGKTYKDYYLTVRNFIRGDKFEISDKPKQEQEHSYNLDTIMQYAINNTPKVK